MREPIASEMGTPWMWATAVVAATTVVVVAADIVAGPDTVSGWLKAANLAAAAGLTVAVVRGARWRARHRGLVAARREFRAALRRMRRGVTYHHPGHDVYLHRLDRWYGLVLLRADGGDIRLLADELDDTRRGVGMSTDYTAVHTLEAVQRTTTPYRVREADDGSLTDDEPPQTVRELWQRARGAWLASRDGLYRVTEVELREVLAEVAAAEVCVEDDR